jgi:phenylacetate-CoA ligase
MLYESLFKHVLFPAYETFAKKRATANHVRECDKNQWLSPEALQTLQLQRLNALLAHCWAEVPFLQTFWGDHGVKAGNLLHVDELLRYPLLTKALITDNYDRMIANNWRGRTMSKATGGSTGMPFRFEYTMDAYARRTAAMWRGYGWAGAGLGARTGYLWGTGMRDKGWGAIKDRLYHGAFNRRFFNVTKLTTDNIDQLIADVQAYKPDALVGYTAPLTLIARHMNETGRHIPPVRGVISAAEALYEEERQAIEQAFGCMAFNTYGSREVMLMAAECNHHKGLHVTADQMILETVADSGQPVPVGQSGQVAITDFFNFGMPMVRYLNGDCATYAPQPCSCGRSLPILASIDGRQLDMIKTRDGRLLAGEIFVTMSFGWPVVHKYQVVQLSDDVLQFRLVLRRPWETGERDRFMAQAQGYTGPTMNIEVIEVNEIPVNATGKRRITISPKNLHMAAPLPAGAVPVRLSAKA